MCASVHLLQTCNPLGSLPVQYLLLESVPGMYMLFVKQNTIGLHFRYSCVHLCVPHVRSHGNGYLTRHDFKSDSWLKPKP